MTGIETGKETKFVIVIEIKDKERMKKIFEDFEKNNYFPAPGWAYWGASEEVEKKK